MNSDLQARIRAISVELAKNIFYENNNLHFSFIVRQNRIVAAGFASKKTDPYAKRAGYRFANIHSELSVIKQFGLDYDFRGLTLVNTRVMRNLKSFGMSRPCHICSGWITSLALPFKDIYYTDLTGEFQLLEE